jgi:hypothetical protein
MIHYSDGLKVVIPTEQQFINQFYNWTYKEVARHFKSRKERIPEVVQDIMIRFLGKNFIGRWFYRHLTDEMVTRDQAERILGGTLLIFLDPKLIAPVHGKRSDVKSLWRISDVLKFARFDFDRFYYSIQNHTLDSDRFLKLLGYEAGQYQSLQSLWRQGKIRPSELTEHMCTGKKCLQCKAGLSILRNRGLSLADDWNKPDLNHSIKRLRWNDSQLAPYLRNWKNQNRVFAVPEFIVRLETNPGIQAGLLKYTKILINNEVNNCFKRMARGEDMSTTVFNKGVSFGYSTSETIVYENENDSDRVETVFMDTQSLNDFTRFENLYDATKIANLSELSPDEIHILSEIDMGDSSAREVSNASGVPFAKVHRMRNAALHKSKKFISDASIFDRLIDDVCRKFDCTAADVFSKVRFGKPVLARAELFHSLHLAGIPIQDIARVYGFEENRVSDAIEIRSKSSPPPPLFA